jgi:hypothetical protein
VLRGPRSGTLCKVTERIASITLIEFGFDLENLLYVKVAGSKAVSELLSDGLYLSLNFRPAASGCR